MNTVDFAHCVRVESLMIVNVGEFMDADVNGISEWNYPDDMARQTIALAIDDAGEFALMVDSPESRSIVEGRGLEIKEDDPEGEFGDGNQGTVEVLRGSTGYVVVERTQRFSDEFCDQWGIPSRSA